MYALEMLIIGITGFIAIPFTSSIYWTFRYKNIVNNESYVLETGAVGQIIAIILMITLSILLGIPLTEFFHCKNFSMTLTFCFFTPMLALFVLLVSTKIADTNKDLMKIPLKDLTSIGFKEYLILLVLAPVAEELIFRGFLQYSLSLLLNKTAALVLVSLIFSLAHFEAIKPRGLPLIFIIGAILGLPVYLELGLYASIFSHSIINFYGITKLSR